MAPTDWHTVTARREGLILLLDEAQVYPELGAGSVTLRKKLGAVPAGADQLKLSGDEQALLQRLVEGLAYRRTGHGGFGHILTPWSTIVPFSSPSLPSAYRIPVFCSNPHWRLRFNLPDHAPAIQLVEEQVALVNWFNDLGHRRWGLKEIVFDNSVYTGLRELLDKNERELDALYFSPDPQGFPAIRGRLDQVRSGLSSLDNKPPPEPEQKKSIADVAGVLPHSHEGLPALVRILLKQIEFINHRFDLDNDDLIGVVELMEAVDGTGPKTEPKRLADRATRNYRLALNTLLDEISDTLENIFDGPLEQGVAKKLAEKIGLFGATFFDEGAIIHRKVFMVVDVLNAFAEGKELPPCVFTAKPSVPSESKTPARRAVPASDGQILVRDKKVSDTNPNIIGGEKSRLSKAVLPFLAALSYGPDVENHQSIVSVASPQILTDEGGHYLENVVAQPEPPDEMAVAEEGEGEGEGEEEASVWLQEGQGATQYPYSCVVPMTGAMTRSVFVYALR